MRSPLSVLCVSFALLFSFSELSQGKPQSSESTSPPGGRNDSTIISLLQQSHDLNPQLPARMRLSLLRRQAQMVSSLRADLGQEWANELLSLSLQTEGNERSWAQDGAMAILARLNPDRAVGLLHTMSVEEPGANGTASPLQRQLVGQVFQILVARDGVGALPVLEQEAERLGIQGRYPYAAIGQAAMQSVSKEWGSNKQHAVEVVQSVFERGFANYSQDARRGYFDDLEFGNMLRVVAGGLPQESVQPALRLLVKNLLATDTKAYQFQAEVYTKDGKKARADNAIDAAILNLGTLVNRIDPELAQELEITRPELKVGLQYARDDRLRSGMFGPRTRPADSEAETRRDALRLSHINAEAAIAKAEQLPKDINRASTILEVARGISGDNPERAAELIAEAEEGEKEPSEESQLDLISARAHVAASQGQRDELRELLLRGFASANRIILKHQVERSYFTPGLGGLVQIGIQIEPDLTVTFVQNLPASSLKAELLLGAASALNMRVRLPLGSRQKQGSERPAQ